MYEEQKIAKFCTETMEHTNTREGSMRGRKNCEYNFLTKAESLTRAKRVGAALPQNGYIRLKFGYTNNLQKKNFSYP
ncbi:hypothetical protein EHQ81_14660 [Leptospira selangorensis]|uniref:Uncharacterized protein n=1 Tax=Leptospira selangorensis TaxID=2484982 RepID=A0A5F2BXA3_9LEPT|nr:hypothetical protein [Leptospira selangorensis]TGM12304.1 hypothetical protein EHQ81_14660 [Leptospira selangorensis]TGM14653.1 hypothetical protein EHQ82_17950 [Leptospira selangorensis]